MSTLSALSNKISLEARITLKISSEMVESHIRGKLETSTCRVHRSDVLYSDIKYQLLDIISDYYDPGSKRVGRQNTPIFT